ncbi:Uma2 family endonuclease [Nonomuraea sp. NPDC059007]|uniref:Uma2 family endonuclease n=1 Tax=Nonomuraea sp. NPDC059007 TaxID=3346692 RepID=UPI003685626D
MATVLPDWFHPGPREGWTADMLDHLLPDAPKHVDLIDGSLFTRSPQTNFHAYVVNLLIDRASGIRPPHHLAVAREMTVALGERQRPEADVMAVSRTAASQPHRTSYSPDEVHLIVEVVSKASEELDRTTKPSKYADAGIRFFWRIEEEDGAAVAYTFELEPAVKAYVPTGIHLDYTKLI